MTIFVLAGLLGYFGPRSSAVSAAGGGYQLDVRYAQVTRSGLVAPLRVRVGHPGGFEGPITLAFSKDIFDRFDFQNWYPVPAAESRAGNTLDYEFDPSGETTMTIALDARSAPGQFGAILPCEVTVESPGRPTLTMSFTTLRLP